MKVVGNTIRERLEAMGKNQSWLSRALVKAPNTVSRWVNNESLPGGEDLLKLELLFGVPGTQLFVVEDFDAKEVRRVA